MQFFVVYLQMSFTGYLTSQLPRRCGKILETKYEGTKKVKDTKLQMLTIWFEELKMSEDESFDSFYGKPNEVVISKFNLGENPLIIVEVLSCKSYSNWRE